jgi:predicted nucleic acid-binding protein
MWDTSVVLKHYRTGSSRNSFYSQQVNNYQHQYISAIAKMEVLRGANAKQTEYWERFFQSVTTVPFTEDEVVKAFEIVVQLKRRNQLIDSMDIMIAATALEHKMPLATLNREHYERIEGLKLILPG